MITELTIVIFKYISVFCEIFFMLDFLNRISSKSIHIRNLLLFTLPPFLCALLGLNLNGQFWDHTLILFPAGFFYILLVLKDRLALGSFLTVTYVVGVMTQRYVLSISFHSVLDPLKIFSEEQMTILIFTATCFCIFALSRLLLLIGRKSSLLFPRYYWWIFMSLQIFVYILLKSIETILLSEYSPTLLLLSGTIYIFILADAYLFSRMSQDFSHVLEQSLYEQQNSIQVRHQAEVQKLYEELRKLRHELKNHFFYLENLLDEENYQEARIYLKQITRTPQNLKQFVDTGNASVNAILNSKIYLADSKGIKLTVTGTLPPSLSIRSGDLFGLVSNLLDNALENTDPKHPVVNVKTEIVKSYFSIVVHNTVKTPVLLKNPLLHTTKTELHAHGYGLKVVRSITEKYNGILDFWEDETGFTMSVMLSLKECGFE